MKKIGKVILDKLKKVIYYISLAFIFIVIACMIALPFGIKKTSFKNDDIVFNKKTYNVISVNGKVNVRVSSEYINTGISYDKYNDYIKSYSKNSMFKRCMLIELFLLFVLLEVIFVFYIVSNVIKLFIDTETDEYRLYIIKKSFVVNVLSIYIIDFLRRFFFRNTMFSDLSLGLALFYILSILVMYIMLKIVEMNKVNPIKEKKKYGKIKENN